MEYETAQLWAIAGMIGAIMCVIMFAIQRKWDTVLAWAIVFVGQVSAYGYLAKLITCGG